MEQLISMAAGTFLALFPITDPLGAIPVSHSLTVDSTPHHRGRQARQVATFGKRGLQAFTQVLGFLILAIAIQLMSEVLFSLIRDLLP